MGRDTIRSLARKSGALDTSDYGVSVWAVNEITTLRAKLERAEARVSDLEMALDCHLQEFEQSEAAILRKQAEAVEVMSAELEDEAKWIINERHGNYQRYYAKAGKAYAQRLRTQAEQMEKGGE